jgi:hypothetical protein
MTVSMHDILCAVSAVSGVSVQDILSHRRRQEINLPRMACYWLARKHTALSYPQIGRHLGDRSHSTLINGIQHVERWLAQGGPEAEFLLCCERLLKSRETRGWADYLARARRARRPADWPRLERDWPARPPRPRPEPRLRRAVIRPEPRPPRAVIPPFRPRAHVPPGMTLTGVLLGDPPPGRSALDRMKQEKTA